MASKKLVTVGWLVATILVLAFVFPVAPAEAAQKPRVEFRAEGAVRSVALSADGGLAVAGSADGKVHLFQKDGSAPLWSHAAGSAVNLVGISSDGSKLAAGTEAGKVLLFQGSSSVPAWTADLGGSVTALALSGDGSTVAAGSYQGQLALHSTSSSTPLWSASQGGSVLSLALSSDGSALAAALSDGRLLHFTRSSSEPDWNLTIIQSFSSVAMSSDGGSIAAGGRDGRVYFLSGAGAGLWNHSTGGVVNCVAVSADGSTVAAGTSMTNRLHLYARASPEPLWSSQGGSMVSVSLSSNGSVIAAGGFDGQVYLHGREGSTPLWRFDTGDMVSSVSLSSNGELAASGSENGRFYLLNRTVPNSPPSLGAGSVSPPQGTNATVFVYRVTYTDLDDEAPEFMKLYIDSTEHAMVKEDRSDVTYTDGVVYELRTSLLLGGHVFRFEASDGKGSVRLPASGDYTGPNVVPSAVNTPPSLAGGRVSPDQGGTTTRFTFSVTYTDGDGDPPSFVSAFIDGENRTMKKLNDVPYTDGVEYRLETTLNTSAHSFHFEASDGKDAARFPSSGELPGPVVSPTAQNNPPLLSAPAFSPPGGNTSTPFTFQVTYADVDDQLPAVKDVVIDGTSRSMVFANGTPASGSVYTLVTVLSAGVHSYHFSFSDGRDAARFPSSGELSTPNITQDMAVEPPVAAIMVSPLKVRLGDRVVFDGSSSRGNISAYFFDFGDGTTSDWIVNPSVDHIYDKAGKYSPKLKVRDLAGRESYFQVGPQVTVEKEPEPAPASPLLLGVVAFLALAGAGAVVYFIAYALLRLPGKRRSQK